MRVFALLLAFLLPAAANAQQIMECPEPVFHDGDTLKCWLGSQKGGEIVRVRLSGIDAPELDQPGGVEATTFAQALIGGQKLWCNVRGGDRYGRAVAWCHTSQHLDIGKAIVRAGWAWNWQAFSRGMYADDEAAARRDHLGVWREPGAVPPWEWRKAKAANGH